MAQKKYKVREGYVVHLSKGRILKGGNILIIEEKEIANQKWKVEEVPCELEIIRRSTNSQEVPESAEKESPEPVRKPMVKTKK